MSSMKEIDFMSVLHKSTSRDYISRVNDKKFPKAKAATLAKKFASRRVETDDVQGKNPFADMI